MIRRTVLLPLLLAAACAEPAPEAAPGAPAPPTAPASAWLANPAPGVRLSTAGDTLHVATGPHAVAWDPRAAELAPPYLVTATLQKRSGRLHEGVGLVFGGSALDGPESGQVYSYFLIRGDGSFLVKKRQGAETPVVRDWTRHPAVRRDQEEGGRPNDLAVLATDSLVVFQINGVEVARVPAAELALRGRAGIRVSHDVEVAVAAFRAEALQ